MKEKIAQRLFVFVPPRRALPASGKAQPTASTVVGYVAVDSTGSMQPGETPIALLPKASRVDVVFDTADVFVAAIDVPRLSEARLRLALPNILEERLLADATDGHFAFTLPGRSGGATTVASAPKLPVAVVDRGLLTRTLDALAESGYRPRAAYNEIYTVPAPAAGVLSVRVDRGHAIARLGKHDGFAFEFEGDEAPPALLLAIRQLGIKRIAAYGRGAAVIAALAPQLNVVVDVTQRDLDLDASDGAVNLLQGAFAPGGTFGGMALPKISAPIVKLVGAWLAVAAVAFIAGLNVYWFKLDADHQALRANMETAFRSAFPDITAVVDPVLQTRQSIGTLRARSGIVSPTDFSVLNAQVAQLLSQAPVGSVATIDYRDGALKVKFKPGIAENPGLQNTLRGQAMQQGLLLRFDADGAATLAPNTP